MASARPLALLVLALTGDVQARPEPGAPTPPGPEAPAGGAPAREVPAPPRNAAPDDTSWEAFPGATAVPQAQEDAAALPRMPEVPPLVPVSDVPLPEPRTEPVAPPPRPPNRVSLLGARTVGAGGMAAGVSLGFPSVSGRVAVGLARRVDALVGLDSVYGLMNELRVGARWMVLDGGARWSLGVAVEGSHAFFLRPASVEERGARYVSGRRNWNVLPGIVGTFQFAGTRAPRLFLDARYLLALDTEPVQGAPLGGLPPDVEFSSAFPIRVGAEVPVSEKTSYAVTLGGDIRTRPGDADFMPVISFGVVTGF
ncbi:hypothetical protein [Comamonas sp. JC664]|uniref:hypothetical protein n=1 Tax=Comamonas sp. JC664 TaxID=2801917 RepID=UPI00174EA89F|nr:hypothetical protein [Comamonas sp. JC664]MBL0697669.1 hypothetical protein [Comamonas sp. JC664]GHG68930.1 hypothetical protein GCM10012319_12610 [Comamonas sp. KCTC 72670]